MEGGWGVGNDGGGGGGGGLREAMKLKEPQAKIKNWAELLAAG